MPETSEAETVMEGMVADGADLIFATSYGYFEFAQHVAERHPDVVVVHQGGLEEAPGLDNFGTYFGTVIAPFELNLPAHRTYVQAMTAYAPEIQPPQNQLALNAWLGPDLMIRGLEEAGSCPTRQAFIAALRKIRNFDGDGLVRPAVDLSNYREPNRCLFLVRVAASGQQYEPVGTDPICGQILSRQ